MLLNESQNTKQNTRQNTKNDNVLLRYSIVITAFVFILNRLFFKMDDGNFLGIALNPEFTYFDFLKERYNTVSGRTTGEFLVMFFLRNNQMLYKLSHSALLIYIAWFWSRISDCFANAGNLSKQKRHTFACFGLFLMFVSCLNPAVFWYAGSFSYLWPFAGVLITIYPILFYVLEGNVSKKSICASLLFAPLATAQEQSCAALIFLYIVLIGVLLFSDRDFKFRLVLPLIPAILCTVWLFSAPGMQGRTAMEASSGFERYFTMGLPEKLLAGFSVFYANTFYLSFALTILLGALLSFALYQEFKCLQPWDKKDSIGRVLIGSNLFIIFNSVVLNAVIAVISRKLPHITVREVFINGESNAYFWILFISSSIALSILLIMAIILFVKNPRLGGFVLLFLAAAFGCGMAMSFSSSIFASGQRVFFYTNAFIITACVVLISTLPNNKHTNKIYNCAATYAAITFIVDVFAFSFIELPLMG